MHLLIYLFYFSWLCTFLSHVPAVQPPSSASSQPDGAASFLEAKPQLGFSPYGAGTRQMTNTMGLAPAGIDCCPCIGNEEDYRVYPWHGMAGPVFGGRKGVIGGNPAAAAVLPFV